MLRIRHKILSAMLCLKVLEGLGGPVFPGVSLAPLVVKEKAICKLSAQMHVRIHIFT